MSLLISSSPGELNTCMRAGRESTERRRSFSNGKCDFCPAYNRRIQLFHVFLDCPAGSGFDVELSPIKRLLFK